MCESLSSSATSPLFPLDPSHEGQRTRRIGFQPKETRGDRWNRRDSLAEVPPGGYAQRHPAALDRCHLFKPFFLFSLRNRTPAPRVLFRLLVHLMQRKRSLSLKPISFRSTSAGHPNVVLPCLHQELYSCMSTGHVPNSTKNSHGEVGEGGVIARLWLSHFRL